MPAGFKLRFAPRDIRKWAALYDAGVDEPVDGLGAAVRARGYLDSEDLRVLARWKTTRSAARVARNEAEFVRATTAVALSTGSERLRIEALILLQGVDWPTASVILHFAHTDPYPILDYRALWSLGVSRPPHYTFEIWERYVAFTRDLARQQRVSMRELDRALWQYSKERQR